MEMREVEQQIAALAALDEPVRRSLYLYVASRQGEVSRDQAARAVGVSRSLAGFHLDRLAEEGLLETSFRRLSGRTGPGAGRPSKLYRRSGRQLAVSLPPRSYELAARLLATAVDASSARQTQSALKKTARTVGERIGAEARARAGSRPGKKRLLESTVAALAAQGYQPEEERGEIRLRNCPFHSLVSEHKDLVCGMNLALIEGVVAGLDAPGFRPALDPKPGRCCVTLRVGTK
ncbi:MAG: helix-turn-helix transcriptional regulator [Gemmatimonadales bacterium]